MDGREIRIKRRKYRLNKRKFTVTLLVLFSMIALIIFVAGKRSRELNTDADITVPGDQIGGMSEVDSGPLVVLDAGHGGFDPGTIGITGTREDVLNLNIAQRLKVLLEQDGMRVYMTREDDNALADTKDDDMEARRRMIEESGADIVVSIHMNWYEEPEISGPTVLFCPGSEPGRRFAETVQNSMNTILGANGNARPEDFLVLRSGSQPCIMVECGYISNAEEEKKLKQEDYQQMVAEAICEGVQRFIEEGGE